MNIVRCEGHDWVLLADFCELVGITRAVIDNDRLETNPVHMTCTFPPSRWVWVSLSHHLSKIKIHAPRGKKPLPGNLIKLTDRTPKNLHLLTDGDAIKTMAATVEEIHKAKARVARK